MIAAEKPNNEFPLRRMCGLAGVSESGFYTWRRRAPSASARRRAVITALVIAVFTASNGVFGYCKVHAELIKQGHSV